ncbi:MAG: ABC transporter ATP-binding protein, partial [Gammaproteobacteria bacterium]
DPQARALFKARLRQARDEGATVLFSSHLLADIDELCERMVILHGGAIRYDGDPAACRAQYGAVTLEQAFLRVIQ